MSRNKLNWSERTAGDKALHSIGVAVVIIFIIVGIRGIVDNDDSKSIHPVVVTGNVVAKDSATTSAIVTAPAITVTVMKLLDEYDSNEVAADMKYKGKIISVTGYVSSVQSLNSTCYVKLTPSIGSSLITVDCYFRLSSHQQQIAQIKEGQLITITGTCHGEGFLYVGVRECYFLDSDGG